MTVIRELVAFLGFDVDEKALKQAEAAMDDLGKLALVASGAVAAVGGALAVAVVQTARYGDEHAKAAKRIGLSVEALQELEHAGKLSGASVEDMRAALRGLAKNTGEAARGSAEQAKTFASLGVRLKDAAGKTRPLDEVLGEVADKLQQMPDASKRVAYAQKLMEEAGVRLIPMLEQGAAGIEAMRKEARDLGIVMDAEAAGSAEQFTDELERAQSVVLGISRDLGSGLLPVLSHLLIRFREWVQANRVLIRQNIDRFVNGLVDTFTTLSKIVRSFVPHGLQVTTIFGAMRIAAIALSVALGVGLLVSIGKLAVAFSAMGLTIVGVLTGITKALVLPAITGAFFVALAVLIGLVIDDFYRFASGADAADTAIGTFLDRFNKPFNANDTPLVTGLKIIAKILNGIVYSASAAGEALGKLGIIFDDDASPQQKVQAGRDLGEQFTGIDEAEARRRAVAQVRAQQVKTGSPLGRRVLVATGGGPSNVVQPSAVARAVGLSQGGPTTIADHRSVKVEVNGAGDPRAVADEVVRRASEEIDLSLAPAVLE